MDRSLETASQRRETVFVDPLEGAGALAKKVRSEAEHRVISAPCYGEAKNRPNRRRPLDLALLSAADAAFPNSSRSFRSRARLDARDDPALDASVPRARGSGAPDATSADSALPQPIQGL